jgi:hypothetical protein
MKKTMTAAHSGNTFPHGGLALEQTSQSHSEGKPRNERSKAAGDRRRSSGSVRGASLISTGKSRHEHLDEVRRMQQAGELDRIRNPEREDMK